MKEVDTNTLELLPNSTPIPMFTDAEAIEQSITDIVNILKNPSKNNIPKVLVGDKICNAFQYIAIILNRDTAQAIPEVKPTETTTKNTQTLESTIKSKATNILKNTLNIPRMSNQC